jgi:hypothetical protein
MAPRKIAREMSYVTGWFMLMGKLLSVSGLQHAIGELID